MERNSTFLGFETNSDGCFIRWIIYKTHFDVKEVAFIFSIPPKLNVSVLLIQFALQDFFDAFRRVLERFDAFWSVLERFDAFCQAWVVYEKWQEKLNGASLQCRLPNFLKGNLCLSIGLAPGCNHGQHRLAAAEGWTWKEKAWLWSLLDTQAQASGSFNFLGLFTQIIIFCRTTS
jgi:hypothetical protein